MHIVASGEVKTTDDLNNRCYCSNIAVKRSSHYKNDTNLGSSSCRRPLSGLVKASGQSGSAFHNKNVSRLLHFVDRFRKSLSERPA